MNRWVGDSTKLTSMSRSEHLPPVLTHTALADRAARPVRTLFLHITQVGFGTTTANLEHFANARPDLDAVHVRLVMPLWLRAWCKQAPFRTGEWEFLQLRHMLGWSRHLSRLVGGPGSLLPLERFDVVHVMTQQRAGFIRSSAARRAHAAGTRFAVNIDATLRGWEAMRRRGRSAPALDWSLERKIYSAADMVACASRWCAASVVNDYSVDERKAVIHKPCARLESIGPRIPHGGPLRLLFVGGHWQDKGGPRLLQWHQQRWADRAELHIVSATAPRDASARNVMWHGRVEHSVLLGQILPQMDVFVVPTKWDTFMIAAQEAQAAGLPVVTTRCGGVPEVVDHGVTGFVCDHDDDAQFIGAVEKLMTDAELRKRMSLAAQSRARERLSATAWHTHLLDQLVRLGRHEPVHAWPAGVPVDSATPAPAGVGPASSTIAPA